MKTYPPLIINCPHGTTPHAHRSQARIQLCGFFERGFTLPDSCTGKEPPEQLLELLIPPNHSPQG